MLQGGGECLEGLAAVDEYEGGAVGFIVSEKVKKKVRFLVVKNFVNRLGGSGHCGVGAKF